MSTASISLGAVNVEALNPVVLSAFWAAVTGGSAVVSGDTVFLPAVGPAGFAMFFHRSTEPRPQRTLMHLDLTVTWGSRVSEVGRLEGLGAVRQWDVLDEAPHVQWTTMADPEGNLFCVAEHPPRAS